MIYLIIILYVGPQRELVYQHASQNTNFNEIFLITSDGKKQELIDEVNFEDKVLLQRAFAKHCTRLHFNGDSGLIPYRILALNVYIQRISPTFYNYETESSDDDI